MILVFILFGITQIPDGAFIRPHPGIVSVWQCFFIENLLLIYFSFMAIGFMHDNHL